MTKYHTRIGERSYDVTVAGEGRAPAVTVDGAAAAVDFYEVARGAIYSLILDGHSYELWVRKEDAGYAVFVAGHTLAVQVEDERQRRSRELRGATAARGPATAEVKAPMPALVLDVMVAPGDEVAEGQGLCVLEAMKMENLMRAPRAGVVKEVKVTKGQGVALNDVLVVIG